jgi:hypothetical protein
MYSCYTFQNHSASNIANQGFEAPSSYINTQKLHTCEHAAVLAPGAFAYRTFWWVHLLVKTKTPLVKSPGLIFFDMWQRADSYGATGLNKYMCNQRKCISKDIHL